MGSVFTSAIAPVTRGMSSMLRQRVKRVLLPLLMFLPLLYFAMEALMRRALEQVQHPSPLMLLIKQWLSHPNPPALPPSLMHLWFLSYLMCFCLLIWVTATLEFSFVAQRFANARLRSLVMGAPLLLPALLSVSAPTPAPENFLPQWWALLYFGGYFFLGFQLHQRQAFISELKAIAPWLLAGAISAYGAFFGYCAKTPISAVGPGTGVAVEVCTFSAGQLFAGFCQL
jgi:glucans biosynthesis protein C